ncbi:MAG: hypothetical protein WC789_08060 [Lentisphaeria bacterium]
MFISIKQDWPKAWKDGRGDQHPKPVETLIYHQTSGPATPTGAFFLAAVATVGGAEGAAGGLAAFDLCPGTIILRTLFL